MLLAIAVFIVRPYLRGNNPVPSKPYSVLEMLLEYFWEMVKNAVGSKWVGRVFPVVMTIFLLILTANWIKLLPGFETVGWFREASAENAEKAHPVLPFVGGLYALDGTTDEGTQYELVPFLRGSSTDLNFPASMAVVTVGGDALWSEIAELAAVRDVARGGPAWNAGLRRGDVILSINGEAVSSYSRIAEIVNESIDVPLEVVWLRDGREQSAVVTPDAAEVRAWAWYRY